MAVIGYIYLHRSPSGKGYIGQTTMNPPELRWSSKAAYSANVYFSAAITKHGWENFEHKILAEVSASTREDLIEKLNELEPVYIRRYDTLTPNGYNISPGGSNAPCAEETKQKIREKLKGRTRSAESIQRQKIAQLGRQVSQETRDKLRVIHTGRTISLKQRQKLSNSLRGNKNRAGTSTSEQGLANIRAAALSRAPMSEETKRKIGEGNKGKIVSAGSRKKISEARLGIQFSEDHCKKLSEWQKGKPKLSSKYIHTKDQAEKAWETRRLNGTAVAPNKGRVCITNGINNRYIVTGTALPEGWYYGSAQLNKIKKYDKTWLNDGQYAYFISNAEVDKYLALGYEKGKNGFKKKPI